MSKANKFLTEEDAVSPVIGVILMVAITVILAAVIAAFVFSMGPPEQAPVASIRFTAVATNNLTLQHQGGDSIDLYSTSITVSQGDNVFKITKVNDTVSSMFEGGDLLKINSYTGAVLMNGVTTGPATATGKFNISSGSSDDVKVSIIDTVSGQMIADVKYNV